MLEDIKYFDKIINIKSKEEIEKNSFCWIYPFTNENIEAYYSYIDFNNKNVLTVTSSGDHLLNALLNGANEITSFDINPLAKRYVELKVAAIKSLSIEEFLLFFYNKKMIGVSKFYLNKKTYFDKISNTLDEENKTFWDYIFAKYDIDKIYKSYIFTDDYLGLKSLIQVNAYLKEENYYKLREILNNKKFKYYDKSLNDIDKSEKYDVIILSNIASFIDLDNEESEISKLKNNIDLLSNDSAIVVVSYLYTLNGLFAYEGIYNNELVRKYFKDSDYQYLSFDRADILAYPFIFRKIIQSEDSVLITRKK